ncbi:hypothetical protein ACFW6W_09000, partial [Streptomyces parvulus]
MGFLDRLRGRRDGVDGGGGETASPVVSARPLPDAGDGPDAGSGANAPATRTAVAAWTGLPPIQRATGAARAGVADAGFGGRLPTWQNPSFTGAPSPAVLNPAAGDSLLSGAFDSSASRNAPARPVQGTAPVQRMPVAPLRAIPADTAAPAGEVPGARGGPAAAQGPRRPAPATAPGTRGAPSGASRGSGPRGGAASPARTPAAP